MRKEDLEIGKTYYYNLSRLGLREIKFIGFTDDGLPKFNTMGEGPKGPYDYFCPSDCAMKKIIDNKEIAHLRGLQTQEYEILGNIATLERKIQTLRAELSSVERPLSEYKKEYPEEFL